MEASTKSFDTSDITQLKVRVIETPGLNTLNHLMLSWDDLPGFILDFPYYCFLTNKVFEKRKKETILMALSKMTGIYKDKIYGHTLTDLSKPNVPRFHWDYTNEYDESSRGVYSFMMEILRMTVIPRLHKIPKL